MSAFNFKKLELVRSRRNEYYIRVTTPKTGRSNRQLVIGLSVEAMKDLRWVIGDRVNIEIDVENGLLGLARHLNGDIQVCPSNSTKGASNSLLGKMVSAVVQFTPPKGFPWEYKDITAFFQKEDVIIEGNTMGFIFPTVDTTHEGGKA